MLGLLIIGIVLLVVVYSVPDIPPPLNILLKIFGLIFVCVPLVVLCIGLMGVALPPHLRWGC